MLAIFIVAILYFRCKDMKYFSILQINLQKCKLQINKKLKIEFFFDTVPFNDYFNQNRENPALPRSKTTR